jgi:tRNA uridine 5-carbamoylmethylation protein Kti12
VRIAAPEDLEREVAHFEPHLIVANEVTTRVQETVTSVIRVMYEDSLNARVYVDGQESSEVQDISMKDLLAAVDETERIVSQG